MATKKRVWRPSWTLSSTLPTRRLSSSLLLYLRNDLIYASPSVRRREYAMVQWRWKQNRAHCMTSILNDIENAELLFQDIIGAYWKIVSSNQHAAMPQARTHYRGYLVPNRFREYQGSPIILSRIAWVRRPNGSSTQSSPLVLSPGSDATWSCGVRDCWSSSPSPIHSLSAEDCPTHPV